VLGILVLGILAVGLFCWKSKQTPPTVTAQATSATAIATTAPTPPPPQFAPPPPPKLDDEPDAGKPVAKSGSPSSAGSAGAPGGAGPCTKCSDGQVSGALTSALRTKAQSATGCYQRALRTSEVSGSMTVSVQVGPSGSVCSASIVNDSVHSAEVSTCVLSRFKGQTFPPPTQGCVTVGIPISFTIKQ
jgi:TonB family protein